ncbi:MAG: bifunctional 4-hydroxy-2-oxoglutarate aldolase/2-dehydro-3-deoxy-phosphogluconate aldolase [Clostridia bacterium]|nr:bifunctional 4-hydroxy-2-oxoglutarate aldolase/2-dehydro-3-deoxy-phosphogluconate aldolase [Clostridia bacterium]
MNKQQVMQLIEQEKLVVIVRGVAKEKLIPLCGALYRGGVRLLEITFDARGNTPWEETAQSIAMLDKHFEGRICIGAGTVLNTAQAELAVHAGAKYLISPNVSPAVIAYAKEAGVVSMPGAMTPTEIVDAYNAGADFVKVFPADSMGLSYVKAVRAPLSHIPMIAVGGVDEKNVGDFLAIGLSGVGVGSNIVKKAMLDAEDYDGIAKLAGLYTEAIKRACNI